jgi:hypothetical protein
MRQAIKPALGALLALLALAALTSTASAATCKKGALEAEHKVLCVEGKQIGSVGEKVNTTAGFTKKAGAAAVIADAQLGWSVSCASVRTFSGTEPFIRSGGSGEVSLEGLELQFSECKTFVEGFEKPECEASGSTQTLAGLLANPEAVTLAQSGSEVFGSLIINGGGCLVTGSYTLKGAEVCSLKQPEIEAVAKELVCEPKNSKLKIFGSPATLKLEGSIALAGASKGKKFSITK